MDKYDILHKEFDEIYPDICDKVRRNGYVCILNTNTVLRGYLDKVKTLREAGFNAFIIFEPENNPNSNIGAPNQIGAATLIIREKEVQ